MINWQSIDTVLLDMDGTLLDLHYDNHFWLEHLPSHVARQQNKPLEEVKDELIQRIMAQKGNLNWYCLDYWSEQLQLDIPALKAEIKHLIAIRPHVEDFLQQLKESHQEVILVTNAHQHGLDIKLKHTGIHRWFDHIVVSHDFKAAKESQIFWQQLQKKHPFDRNRTLFIDDSPAVLAAAHQYGIKHLLTLLQPDSKKPIREATEYPGILHFDEIMPLTSSAGS